MAARADIDGVKYPVDSYGKTVKDGDTAGWNYVSFRDDNIRMDHKWVDGEMRFSITPAEDAAYMDAVKRGDGRVDVSKPYKVEDVAKERPYLKVNQATDSALSDSGQPEAALTKSPVAAARQSLDSLESIIANRPRKVQSVPKLIPH